MTGESRLLAPSFRGYRPAWLRADAVAGLTVWAVLVPESLAYATIAGVPPVVGLYAAIPALLLYALLGSSRHLIVGPMSATAALSAGIVGTFAAKGGSDYVALTAALALVTGIVGLAAGLSRLGFIASFISEPVLKGFIVGLALTIMIGQVPKLLGISGGEGDVFAKAWHVLATLGETDGANFAVGMLSLGLVLGLRRWLPLVPGALAAVLLSIAAATLLNLDDHGVEIVGAIDAGIPALGLPGGLSLDDYLKLVGPSAGVLLIGFAEGLGAAKTYAAKAGYDVDANRELLGLGVANVGSGLASGMVVNGSLSKTAVNGGSGARSQFSALIIAVLTLVTLLFLTGLFESLPEATLAAVVISAVIELADVPALRRLYRVWTAALGSIYGFAARADFAAALAAMVGVLIFDTLPGLIIGIAASMLLLLYRASNPHITPLAPIEGSAAQPIWADQARHPDATAPQDVLVLRVESGLFFANADHTRDHIRQLRTPQTRAVVLDCETTPLIDVTAAAMLTELARDLARENVQLLIAKSIGQVRDVLRTTGVASDLGRIYPSVDAAVDAARAQAPRGDAGPGRPTPPESPDE